MVEMKRFLKNIRWVIIAYFLFGIVLMLVAESYLINDSKFFASMVSNVGMAVMIASIVGFIVEFTEMKNFFEERLKQILKGEEFLSSLTEEKLKEYNLMVMRRIIRGKISNPGYDYNSLPQVITDGILSGVGGVYRDDYHETVEYNVLPQKEREDLALDNDVISKEIVKMTVNIRFNLIAPKEREDMEYALPYVWHVKKIPGLDKNGHCDLSLLVDGEIQPIQKEEFIEETENEILMKFKLPVKFNTSAFVELRAVIYEHGNSGSLASRMETLTHNVNVHFSSDRPLEFSTEIFGMSDICSPPSITKNAVSIRFPGWLLPGHGYYVSWQEL